jgi:2,3-bisphosphoglycerate-independent phosphoglycerate mutase
MKYIVVLGDGMADWPLEELNGLTPLQAANKPHIDFIAKNGRLGLVKTIPEGMSPGSDTANLSVLGYDPKVYHTGRSSLEAVSIGVRLNDGDFAYRCNLVTIIDDIMVDYSAGEISTDEARPLIDDLAKALNIELYAGTSYRHCLVMRDSSPGAILTPPHDFSDREIFDYLPGGQHKELFYSLMKKSQEFLKDHPINIERVRLGKNPANSIWLWGEGSAPALPTFHEKYGKTGSVISAVDLIKGIGICIGLESINVVGATGRLNTNFEGKVDAALNALKTRDFVYLHIEAPDECGHQGQIHEKVLAIEYIDERVVKPILAELEKRGEEFSIMVMPDHPTPLKIKTHTDEPVPFAYYRSKGSCNDSNDSNGDCNGNGGDGGGNGGDGGSSSSNVPGFCEKSASDSGVYIEHGHMLMAEFLR